MLEACQSMFNIKDGYLVEVNADEISDALVDFYQNKEKLVL